MSTATGSDPDIVISTIVPSTVLRSMVSFGLSMWVLCTVRIFYNYNLLVVGVLLILGVKFLLLNNVTEGNEKDEILFTFSRLTLVYKIQQN